MHQADPTSEGALRGREELRPGGRPLPRVEDLADEGLPRSLVLWRLLRARGATVRLGVAPPAAQGFSAHAWVEVDGQALSDTAAAISSYSAFPAHPAVSGAATRDR